MLATDKIRELACLYLVDIDRLRPVNDIDSAAVGDRLLTAVARTLMKKGSGHLVAWWEAALCDLNGGH